MQEPANSLPVHGYPTDLGIVGRTAGHILCPDVTKPLHDIHISDGPPNEPRWLQILLMTLVVVYVLVRICECCGSFFH